MPNRFSALAQSMAPDIMGSIQQGRAQARQVERERLADQELRSQLDRQNRFRELAGQAYGAADPNARQAVISQAAAVDPQSAMALESQFAARDKTQHELMMERMGVTAGALVNAPEPMRPMLYKAMLPELRKFVPNAPEEYDPGMIPVAQQFLSVSRGAAPAQLQYFNQMTQGMSPEDVERARRVALGIEARPTSAGMSMQKIVGPDGREYAVVFDPRTGQPRPVSMEELFGNLGASPFATSPMMNAGAPSGAPTAAAAPPAQPAAAPSAAPATPPVSAPQTPVASPTPEERKRLEALGTERGRQQAEADPLPGSKEFRERRKAEISGRQLLRRAEEQLGTIDRVASSLKDRADMWTAGFLGSASAGIPGTPAHDFARDLETLKALIGFNELQQMRDASPTGGALGQVSEMENRLLQSAWAALEQSQSPEQFQRNMNVVIDRARRAWRNVKEAYDEEYGDLRRVRSPEELESLPSGTRFIAPDGSVRVKP